MKTHVYYYFKLLQDRQRINEKSKSIQKIEEIKRDNPYKKSIPQPIDVNYNQRIVYNPNPPKDQAFPLLLFPTMICPSPGMIWSPSSPICMGNQYVYGS